MVLVQLHVGIVAPGVEVMGRVVAPARDMGPFMAHWQGANVYPPMISTYGMAVAMGTLAAVGRLVAWRAHSHDQLLWSIPLAPPIQAT